MNKLAFTATEAKIGPKYSPLKIPGTLNDRSREY